VSRKALAVEKNGTGQNPPEGEIPPPQVLGAEYLENFEQKVRICRSEYVFVGAFVWMCCVIAVVFEIRIQS
jgi:hypothetical protein